MQSLNAQCSIAVYSVVYNMWNEKGGWDLYDLYLRASMSNDSPMSDDLTLVCWRGAWFLLTLPAWVFTRCIIPGENCCCCRTQALFTHTICCFKQNRFRPGVETLAGPGAAQKIYEHRTLAFEFPQGTERVSYMTIYNDQLQVGSIPAKFSRPANRQKQVSRIIHDVCWSADAKHL